MHTNLPTLNYIRAFDAAARTGSFKKAAEELFVTPTAISHQIKKLEATLGTLLFVRKTRTIELTQDGKLLAEAAYKSLQQLSNAVTEISHLKNTLTISTTSSFAAMWLVPRLSDFRQKHPEIDIILKTNEGIDDLEKNRKIDLAIRYGHYDESTPNTRLLVTEKIGMFATPSYVDSLRSTNAVNLLETKWHNANLPEITWQKLLHNRPTKFINKKIIQYSQEHYIIQAALAGKGIALVSALLVKNAVDQKWLIKFNHSGIGEIIEGLSYYAVIPKHNAHSKIVGKFHNWLVEELRD